MAAEEGIGDIVRYIYRGQPRAEIPDHVTHVTVKDIKAVPKFAFREHPNIVEVICHDGVKKIKRDAFYRCPNLLRVIMPGVKEIEWHAFSSCKALSYIECGKLERITGEGAFWFCESLSSIDLPSIKIVDVKTFIGCKNLTNVKLGKELWSIRGLAFQFCRSLERITLPLKDGMVAADNTFRECEKLNHVDLIGGVHETVAALLMEEWKNDMNEEIDSINQVLPNTPAGDWRDDSGGKAQAIRTWIRSVLRKIVQYKAEHRRIMDEAAATLQFVLPQDIVRNNVLSFLELPSHTFDGENDDGEEEEDSDEDEEMDEDE